LFGDVEVCDKEDPLIIDMDSGDKFDVSPSGEWHWEAADTFRFMSVPADAVYTVKIVLTYAHHADDEIFVSFEGLTCTISGFGGKWLCKVVAFHRTGRERSNVPEEVTAVQR
jgi:hypothetical protein